MRTLTAQAKRAHEDLVELLGMLKKLEVVVLLGKQAQNRVDQGRRRCTAGDGVPAPEPESDWPSQLASIFRRAVV